ncbi:alpha/beta fold hydrolase [Sneathiella sp.]|uniref:alpha/beta fold hydrolase n=1 Tax=Sneathiella sp. TaxID=1964365 RepID=UPI00356ABC28
MSNMSKTPEPPVRLGPRPLALHLGLATTTVAGSLAGLPLPHHEPLPWSDDVTEQAREMATKLKKYGSTELIRALAAQGSGMMQEMIEGIQKYHQHPYRRKPPLRPVIWQRGSSSLVNCGPDLPGHSPVLFIVPSLVNRAYILDLMPGRSLVDYLAEKGIRPLLLDWGAPGAEEKDFFLSDYIRDRILPALDFTSQAYPETPLHLAGYCMGGTLAVAAAERRQAVLTSFIALAAPWDFHAELADQTRLLLGQREMWSNVLTGFGELPVDLLQALFTSLDPNLGLRKFRMFSKMEGESERATEFVALEDWLNDGFPLVKGVTEDCFDKWYGRNETGRNCWEVAGEPVCPANVNIPSLVAVPKTDKIVPRPSALALASSLPNAKVITPPSGHIGMVTSRHAKEGLWRELADWIIAS